VKLSAKILLLSLFLAGNSYAACTVATTGINFGSYDVFSSVPADSTGTVTVICNAFTLIARLDLGPSPNSGGFNPRRMKHVSAPDLLDYNIFTDASRSTIWGNGTSGTSSIFLSLVPRNVPQILTVYGKITAGQDVRVGSYSEMLLVTVQP
jgi:spore coat protein U-like protein